MTAITEYTAIAALDALESRITSEHSLGVDAIFDLEDWLAERRPDWYTTAARTECERARSSLALAQTFRNSFGDLDEESHSVLRLHEFAAAEAIRKALDYARETL